jgi:glucose/mannose-6-phosphate isomerase
MTNLDTPQTFPALDPQNMLAEIESLPDQLLAAWKLGESLPLPRFEGIRHILIAGMGGSAIGADLLAAYAAPSCALPVFVHRGYALPAFARGKETLVILSSHSGNTEETLSAFDAARARGCQILAVTTGGTLAEKSEEAQTPIWQFSHQGQPRAAVGFSFGLLFSLFTRSGFLSPQENIIEETVAAMRAQADSLHASVPVAKNPAKRMAGQLMGRWVTVMGAGLLAPVARRWKTQINELAKAPANFEFLPEADHNALAGTRVPEDILLRSMTIFLRAPSMHPRNRLRSELAQKAFMLEGLAVDSYEAKGKGPLAHLWTTLHFGDYLSYYLAMAYDTDPTPVDALSDLKAALKKRG